ncbi:DMT family transporter [Patescibacteria group bacterium]|nr:DMT family transporter [Patescibacteria group bacterium]
MGIGIILALGAALSWGIVYALDQKILIELSPSTLLFLYSVTSAVLLLPFVLLDRNVVAQITTLSRETALYVGLSLVLSLIANALVLYSIQNLGAPTAAMLEITYPIFVVLAVLVLFKTVPSPFVLLGGAVILIGAMIVTYYA